MRHIARRQSEALRDDDLSRRQLPTLDGLERRATRALQLKAADSPNRKVDQPATRQRRARWVDDGVRSLGCQIADHELQTRWRARRDAPLDREQHAAGQVSR